MRKFLPLLFIPVFLLGCQNNEAELDHLNAKISDLETELDNCRNGSDKLLASLKLSFEDGQYKTAQDLFKEIKDRHPESPEFTEANEINNKILEEEEKLRIEAEKLLKAEEAKKMAALNKLKKQHDDVSGVTWYKNPYFTHYTNNYRASIYIGETSGLQFLRLFMSYYGEDWIFFETAYLSYDGNTREILFNKYEHKESDHSGGSVWEWINVPVQEEMIPFLRAFANSPNAKMRFTGKYTKTRDLSKNERQGILDVLDGYEVLKNQNNQATELADARLLGN